MVSPSTVNSTLVEVWKDPNCGCCSDWIKHIEDSGFTVRLFDTGKRHGGQSHKMLAFTVVHSQTLSAPQRAVFPHTDTV